MKFVGINRKVSLVDYILYGVVDIHPFQMIWISSLTKIKTINDLTSGASLVSHINFVSTFTIHVAWMKEVVILLREREGCPYILTFITLEREPNHDKGD
jgi:hypothetical protein